MKGLFSLIFLFTAGWLVSRVLAIEGLQPKDNWCEKRVCLESITFNHDPNCNHCDAINIRENFTRDVHVPEWNRGESYPAAYIINKNVTIKAVFSTNSGVKTVRIGAIRKSGEFGDLEEKLVYFKEGGISDPVCFNIPSKTPDAIKSFSQEWGWYCRDIDGSGSSKVPIERSENKIYIILAEPKSPWKTSSQAEPWTDALDLACKWANGATTPEDAAGKITKALYKEIGALYDIREGNHRYTSGRYRKPFALTNFIDNLPKVGIVNCNDMGKALVTFSNIVGCDISYQSVTGFGYVNCIKVVGRGWTNNPFYNSEGHDPNPIVGKDWNSSNGRSSFKSHAFGRLNDKIFDALFTVDIDCVPDYGPQFIEAWLIGQPWERYKKMVIDKKPAFTRGPAKPGTPSSYPFEIY